MNKNRFDDLVWKEDTVYGFDYAIYEQKQNEACHTHSIALVKDVKEKDKVKEIQKWIKIANSVKKELWLRYQGSNDKIQIIKYFNKL